MPFSPVQIMGQTEFSPVRMWGAGTLELIDLPLIVHELLLFQSQIGFPGAVH